MEFSVQNTIHDYLEYEEQGQFNPYLREKAMKGDLH